MKSENGIKADFVKHVRGHRTLVFCPNDRMTAGIPDVFIAEDGRDFWLELKVSTRYGHVDIRGRKLQRARCQQLAALTHNCYYLVFEEINRLPRTVIVHPMDLDEQGNFSNELWNCLGHNHEAVCTDFLRLR